MRILIAEDDFTSRTVLAAVLKKEGHEVTATSNGAEAWQALQQPDAPALAILDWMMPELDGLEVVRRVRAVPTELPPYFIMLTTRSEKDDVIAGLAAGANDYLAKPFNHGELRARVESGRRMIVSGRSKGTGEERNKLPHAEACQTTSACRTNRPSSD